MREDCLSRVDSNFGAKGIEVVDGATGVGQRLILERGTYDQDTGTVTRDTSRQERQVGTCLRAIPLLSGYGSVTMTGGSTTVGRRTLC